MFLHPKITLILIKKYYESSPYESTILMRHGVYIKLTVI